MHSPRDGSWENPLPGNAPWSTWGGGQEAPPAARTPRGTILRAGLRDTAPARPREMKEQLQARGGLGACSPRLLERMRAHTSAPARLFALLFRGCD